MKSNELRIGNYIKTDLGIQIVIPFLFRALESIENDCEPIPLTEDWLCKFGFEKDSFYWSLKDLSIDFEKNGYSYVIGSGATGFKYVHQLQNLYFALTGEELTIKKTDNE